MVCGARLNINLWQAVRRRAEGEWNERGNSLLPVVWLSREEKCTGRLCSVPLKCDMRSLTYKLNVTTGGQFYFNRGDHRQATIHFPPFFPSTAVPSLLLCSGFFFFFLPPPPPFLPLFPPLSPLIPGPTLSDSRSIESRPDRRVTTKSTDRSSITPPIRFPTSFPFVLVRLFMGSFFFLGGGICGLRKARVINSQCGDRRKTRIRSCSVVPGFLVIRSYRRSIRIEKNEHEGRCYYY